MHPLPLNNTQVLILGAGPASIQLAADMHELGCQQIGLFNRQSIKGLRLKKALIISPYVHLEGVGQVQRQATIHIAYYYDDLQHITNQWDLVLMALPADSYLEILMALDFQKLNRITTIVLISPSMGSGLMVQALLQTTKTATIEVISLSAYYADTKYAEPYNPCRAITKALKKRIYLAAHAGPPSPKNLVWLQGLFARHNIQSIIKSSLLEAECFNINSYVHPPLALSPIGLKAIFTPQRPLKYIYKLYPEGPITPETIASMLRLWQEYSALHKALGIDEINLLKFLNDDNYPVPEQMLPRSWIENFPTMSFMAQQFALYVRYSALLIDPYATPDTEGRYFDFSRVPLLTVYQDQNQQWLVPRVPQEDVNKLKTLYVLAQDLNVPMPEASRLLNNYQQALNIFKQTHPKQHESMARDNSKQEAHYIHQAWRLSL